MPPRTVYSLSVSSDTIIHTYIHICVQNKNFLCTVKVISFAVDEKLFFLQFFSVLIYWEREKGKVSALGLLVKVHQLIVEGFGKILDQLSPHR